MKENNSNEKSPSLTRRGFMGGLMASIGIAATEAAAEAPETSPRPPQRPWDTLETNENTDLKERVYAMHQPMSSRVAEHTELLQTDVDIVLERSIDLSEDIEGYDSLFELIQAELSLASIPEPTQTELRDIMAFVPYVESRLDPAAVSRKGAFGVMQLMPATWDDLVAKDEDINSVVDQVRVAGRLLEQTYRYTMQRHTETFDLVTRVVFAGDADRCVKEFVAPALVTAYFCGMGSVANTLDGFVHDYVDPIDVERMKQQGIVAEEYGVFSLFSQAGEVHAYDKNFGSEAAKYFPKALAAQMSVRVNLPAELYERLLHGHPDVT